MQALEALALPAMFALVVGLCSFWAWLTYRPGRRTRLEEAARRAQAARAASGGPERSRPPRRAR